MNIAIPINNKLDINSPLALHFGRCLYFLIINSENKKISYLQNTSQHLGGRDTPPELLAQNNIDILICHDLGPKAINLCQNKKIDVFICKAKTAKQALILWQNKELYKANIKNACQNHQH